MNKELVCGKRALTRKHASDDGVLYMTTDEMKKFVQVKGSEEAKAKLKSVKGVVKRGELCQIFHMFKAGRDEIRKSSGLIKNFRLESPNAPVRAPAPVRRVMNNINSGSNNNKRRPASAASSSNKRRPAAASASPTQSDIERMLNNFASSEGRKRRANKNAANYKAERNKAKNLKRKGLVMKREYGAFGVKVLTRAPPNYRVNNRGEIVNVPGGRSGSNSNNFGVNNGNFSSSNGRGKNVHFGRLMTKQNTGKGKVLKQISRAQKMYANQRVGKGNKMKTLKEFVANVRRARRSSSSSNAPSSFGSSSSSGSSRSRSSPRRAAAKVARKPTFIAFPSVGGEATRRRQTRSVPYHLPGTRSHVSKKQLKFAKEERSRRLKSNERWLKLNAMNRGVVGNRNKEAEIANSKAMLANKILQEIVKNIKNGRISVPENVVVVRAAAAAKRVTTMRNLFGSSSSSEKNEKKMKNSVKSRLMKRLSRRRVRPSVPAAMTVAQAQRVVRVKSNSNMSN
jgi:hypothetical protein